MAASVGNHDLACVATQRMIAQGAPVHKSSDDVYYNAGDVLSLLRFSLPFRIFDETKQRDAIVFDLVITENSDESQSLYMASLLKIDDRYCWAFDPFEVAKVFKVDSTNVVADCLRHLYYHPCNNADTTISLRALLCGNYGCARDLDSWLPAMHSSAQNALVRACKDAMNGSKAGQLLEAIHCNPYIGQTVELSKDIVQWLPWIRNGKITWARVGMIVTAWDYDNQICHYVHPVVKKHFASTGTKCVVPTFRDIGYLGAYYIRRMLFETNPSYEKHFFATECASDTWVPLDRLVFKMLNQPGLYSLCEAHFLTDVYHDIVKLFKTKKIEKIYYTRNPDENFDNLGPAYEYIVLCKYVKKTPRTRAGTPTFFIQKNHWK